MWTVLWTFLTPGPSILLNKAYVVIWTLGKLPLPCLVLMVYEWPLKRLSMEIRRCMHNHFLMMLILCQSWHCMNPLAPSVDISLTLGKPPTPSSCQRKLWMPPSVMLSYFDKVKLYDKIFYFSLKIDRKSTKETWIVAAHSMILR